MNRASRRAVTIASGLVPVLLAVAALLAQTKTTAPRRTAVAPPPVPAAINTITASDLKGDLSFLSSDALAGRYTPSPGLDVAAEFIASQFRAAGLEPGGDQEYFQLAKMVDRNPPKPKSDMRLFDGSHETTVSAANLTIANVEAAESLDRCAVVVFRSKDPDALAGLTLTGKTVIAPAQPPGDPNVQGMEERMRKSRAFDSAVACCACPGRVAGWSFSPAFRGQTH